MKNVLSLPAVRLCLALVLMVAGGCLKAYADTIALPDTTFLANAFGSDLGATGPGTYPNQLCVFPGVCESATVTLSYFDGSSSASVSGTVPLGLHDACPPCSTETVGFVQFYFAVIGSFVGPVPLDIVASASTSVSNGCDQSQTCASSGAMALISASSPSTGQSGSLLACTGAAAVCAVGVPSSFQNQIIPISVMPNTFGTRAASVSVTASGAVGGFASLGGSYDASIDPVVQFAPGFDSTGLTLVFSPNPPSAAPEPTSLLLLGSGITSILWVARRKQRR